MEVNTWISLSGGADGVLTEFGGKPLWEVTTATDDQISADENSNRSLQNVDVRSTDGILTEYGFIPAHHLTLLFLHLSSAKEEEQAVSISFTNSTGPNAIR